MLEANCLLDEPFNFYGGYLQTAAFKKREILKDAVVKKLLAKIASLEKEMARKDEERSAINNVATLNFELAQ